jgi:hypothetical protein
VKFSTATEKDADDKDWRESRKAEKKYHLAASLNIRARRCYFLHEPLFNSQFCARASSKKNLILASFLIKYKRRYIF